MMVCEVCGAAIAEGHVMLAGETARATVCRPCLLELRSDDRPDPVTMQDEAHDEWWDQERKNWE